MRRGAGETRRLQNPHSLFPGEEKENAPFDGVREKGSGRTTGPAGQLAEMRGSSESVPTRPADLLPSAEYIGCRRYCSAAARRTPAVIVGWKIARSVLLLPRIPLRYALPGRVSKAGCQALRNRQGAAAKRERQSIRKYPQLSQHPYVVEWSKPPATTGPKPP